MRAARPFFRAVQKERDAIENSGGERGAFFAAGKRGIRADGRSLLYGAFGALRHGGGAGANPPGTEGAAHGRAAPKAASLGQGRLFDMAGGTGKRLNEEFDYADRRGRIDGMVGTDKSEGVRENEMR